MGSRFAAVLMGSGSDLPTRRATIEGFARLGVPCATRITSAHRTPEATRTHVHDADACGCAVFITAAGRAAHLAGAAAANNARLAAR